MSIMIAKAYLDDGLTLLREAKDELDLALSYTSDGSRKDGIVVLCSLVDAAIQAAETIRESGELPSSITLPGWVANCPHPPASTE